MEEITTQKCRICQKEKYLFEFVVYKQINERKYYRGECRSCNIKLQKQKRDINKDERNAKRREDRKFKIENVPGFKEAEAVAHKNYVNFHQEETIKRQKLYRDNRTEEEKENISLYNKNYREANEDELNNYGQEYYKNNREIILDKVSEYQSSHREQINSRVRKRMKMDPIFKCKMRVSNQILDRLNRYNSSKNGKSCWKHLPYTPQDLKNHLENQFEPWMTWDNHGKYIKNVWDEKDQTTWTWQIDHIIPHSDLPYDSLEHPNFQKAWALSNLRPLRSDINIKEGTNGTRHKKK